MPEKTPLQQALEEQQAEKEPYVVTVLPKTEESTNASAPSDNN